MKVYEHKKMQFPNPGHEVRETAHKVSQEEHEGKKVHLGLKHAFHSFMTKR